MNSFHLYLYGPSRGPLPTSFEETEARLVELPMLHFEPDGSFVWSRNSGREQVSGMIYDANETVQYCELQGHCSRSTWCQLLKAIAGESGDTSEGLSLGEMEVMLLPHRVLQDLQTFEASLPLVADSAAG